jgi:hypothetical protein
LLSYYYGATATVGVLFLLLVRDRLTERGWHDAEPGADRGAGAAGQLGARSMHRILRMFVLLAAGWALISIWIEAIEPPAAAATHALHSATAAFATLAIAYIAWALCRLAIDRHLQGVGGGPKLPGTDEDSEAAPGSRLQTMRRYCERPSVS